MNNEATIHVLGQMDFIGANAIIQPRRSITQVIDDAHVACLVRCLVSQMMWLIALG